MAVSILVVLAILPAPLFAEFEGWVTGQPTSFNAAQAKIIVDIHNEYRSMPNATAMRKMKWSDDLAGRAQTAANNCIYEHTSEKFRRHQSYSNGRLGENIYATTSEGFVVMEPVQLWWDEIDYYKLKDNKCQTGKICGHYTQVVWDSTFDLGCGVKYCNTGLNWNGANRAGWLVFCLYGPGGNRFNTRPYKEGEPCSECPDEANTCENKLCVSSSSKKKREAVQMVPRVKRAEQSSGLPDFDFKCKLNKGPESYFCSSAQVEQAGTGECSKFYCGLPSGGCSAIKSGIMIDHYREDNGLVCGVGGVCKDGVCQADPRADNRTDDCLYGDQQMVFDSDSSVNRLVTCEAWLDRIGNSACLQDYVKQKCCASCKHRNKGGDCPFGDAHPEWCDSYRGRTRYVKFICAVYAYLCCGLCSGQ